MAINIGKPIKKITDLVLGRQKTPEEKITPVDTSNQQQLYSMYLNQAKGLGPSFASMQMRQGMSEAARQASSQAASARGGNVALAQRSAALGQAAANASIANAAMTQRVQEQQAAMAGAAGQAAAMSQTELAQNQANLNAEIQRQQIEYQRKAANKARFDKYFGAGLAAVSKPLGSLGSSGSTAGSMIGGMGSGGGG